MDTKALRQKILDLAIRGKLVPQDPNDEPASALLERIRVEKQQMVKDGKLKPKDIKNDTVIFKADDNLHYEKFQDGTSHNANYDLENYAELNPFFLSDILHFRFNQPCLNQIKSPKFTSKCNS